jgi:hypothetical protein
VSGSILIKPQGILFLIEGFCSASGNLRAFQMISMRRRTTSKSSTAKRSAAPRDLAERFLQVQRLRKQVRDLEQLAAKDRQTFAATGSGHEDERTE